MWVRFPSIAQHMSRADREIRPGVEIRRGTLAEVAVFFRHLQQTYGYEPWVPDRKMQEWQQQEAAGQLDVYVALEPGTGAIIGVVAAEKAFGGGAHGLFLVSDPAFAGLKIGTVLIQRLQVEYQWITLIASPIIAEADVSEAQLVRLYQRLGFKETKRGFYGTQMEWHKQPSKPTSAQAVT